jgi:hypothetical protein
VALPDTPEDWLQFLAMYHDTELPQLRTLDLYYENESKLSYMQPEIMAEVGDRIRPVLIAWPQLVVDCIEERLDPLGFRLPKADEADEDLWRVWRANKMHVEFTHAQVDALAMKRSYLAVGSNEKDADTPLVTVESPLETYAYIDPRTRRVLAALRRTYIPETIARPTDRQATLYLPDETIWYDWSGGNTLGWQETDRDQHNLGVVPVAPMVNRSRTARRYGRSEYAPILPLSDAANKMATDMMVAGEFHAIPLRAIFGVGPDEMVDQEGNQLSALQVIMGKLLAVGGVNGNEVKPHEFSASGLTNFHDTIKLLAQLTASLAALPPQAMGFTSANPDSADAIRAAEARLVKRTERRQTAFGGAYETAMQLVRRIQNGGEADPAMDMLETVWRDAATPTRAQTADAAVKLHAEGIEPTRMAREDLGWTPGQIARAEAEDEKADARQLQMFKLPTAVEQGRQPPAAEPVPAVPGAVR